MRNVFGRLLTLCLVIFPENFRYIYTVVYLNLGGYDPNEIYLKFKNNANISKNIHSVNFILKTFFFFLFNNLLVLIKN